MNTAHTTYAAAGIGSNIAVILPWLCSLSGVQMPPAVAVAVGGLIAAGAGFLLHRHHLDEDEPPPGPPGPPTAPGAPAQQTRS